MALGDESERRLAEALRARATGAGRPGPPVSRQSQPSAHAMPTAGPSTTVILIIALLTGAVLGAALGVFSLLLPGFLPAFG